MREATWEKELEVTSTAMAVATRKETSVWQSPNGSPEGPLFLDYTMKAWIQKTGQGGILVGFMCNLVCL